MSYDLEAIKAALPLLGVLERDGVVMRRAGARWRGRCPFHEEKTGSFYVTEKTDLYKCFGCGVGGDLVKYWQATRGVEFIEALRQLAVLAGTGEMPDGTRLPARKIIENAGPEIPAALGGRDLEKWLEGIEYLRENEERQAHLASWRGFSRDTIAVFVERGLIGLPLYFGKRVWAFPVEARGLDGARFLCGWHCRIEPEKGEKKASWRFVPGSTEKQGSIGAWPMVLGEPGTAKSVLFGEGEWDLMALADVTGWGLAGDRRPMAIFGVRGGRNLAHTLSYGWPDSAHVFIFPDGDETGGSWLEPEGFAAILKARSRTLDAFTFEGVKDFNDFHKLNGTGDREKWKAFFRDTYAAGLRRRRKRKPKPPKT